MVDAPGDIAVPPLVVKSKSSSVLESVASLAELPIPIVDFMVNSVDVVPLL